MIIRFLIIWYIIGHLITIPAMFKKRYPWDWAMWVFLYKGKAYGKMLELFFMALIIYPWFNPIMACIIGLTNLIIHTGKKYNPPKNPQQKQDKK